MVDSAVQHRRGLDLGRQATNQESLMNTQIAEIAHTNAIFAVDNMNSRDYLDTRGRCTSVDAHARNVLDTLEEQGLVGYDREALAVYYGKVAELLREGGVG